MECCTGGLQKLQMSVMTWRPNHAQVNSLPVLLCPCADTEWQDQTSSDAYRRDT